MERYSVGKKIEILKNTDLFSNLKAIELSIIADYSEIRPFLRGDILFVEGSMLNRFYVIIEGEVLIIRDGDGDLQMDVARFVAGDSFGELDLLGNTPRSATAICVRDSLLLMFPSEETSLVSVFDKHPYIAAQILNKLMAIIGNRIRQINRHISEKTPWIKQLQKQLHTDKLTGLYNKMFIDDELDTILHSCGNGAVFLIFKPDNFKLVNDKYGHESGDRVLRLMAILLYSVLREQDYGIRYRGDEFAALLPDADHETGEKICTDIENAIKGMDISQITGDKNMTLTLSMGLSRYSNDEYPDRILATAYDNMMKARKNGGDSVYYD